MAAESSNAPVGEGVTLRPMTGADLSAGQSLSADAHWPHRLADWEQAFRHAEGVVAESAGQVIGTGLRWRWDARHATIGLVLVSPAWRDRQVAHRLVSALLDGLRDTSVLLHTTVAALDLYQSLGFVRIGDLAQHQGIALPAPLIALEPGWRLRPAGHSDVAVLQSLDAQARGMHRPALIAELVASAEAAVVLDHNDSACGFGLLRRFGRGHAIGPVIAGDSDGAKALIAYLSGLNAGRFTRIDVDAASHLSPWLEGLGLRRVDTAIEMLRGPALSTAPDAPRLHAIVTQALG